MTKKSFTNQSLIFIFCLLSACASTSPTLPIDEHSSSSEQSIISSQSSLSIETNSSISASTSFPYPISDAKSRITKKQFGTYVTPTSSPIQPEKFTGFHTGIDFETFADEQDTDVSITAICEGKVIFAGHVNGYGGVLIQSCLYKGEVVTVLYGHLKQSSISFKKNDVVASGDRIGILGKGFSNEIDFERKHLHLGIHTGNSIEYRGYVKSDNELSGWIDPY
ncbi:MAG: M23 family metallopeptidase [Candidatus Peribacteraceae bacterium]|nr:M23 family metallopeptidase [Candidatus Peribacteraceae bacterium]